MLLPLVLLSHGHDPRVDVLLLPLHGLDVVQELANFLGGHLHFLLAHGRHLGQSHHRIAMETPSQKDRYHVCVQMFSGTYICHFALDVFQQMFMSSDEVGMLELCVVSLWFHQTALLDVNHLPKTI